MIGLQVCNNYEVTVMIGGEQYTLGLFDTSGNEDNDRFRLLSYQQTDVFVVCFSVISPSSYESVKTKVTDRPSVFTAQRIASSHAVLKVEKRSAWTPLPNLPSLPFPHSIPSSTAGSRLPNWG